MNYYDNVHDIYMGLFDTTNIDFYPDKNKNMLFYNVDWDNLCEITISVISRDFALNPKMVKYLSQFVRSIIEKDPRNYVDRVTEYARLLTGLIDYNYVKELYEKYEKEENK